MEESLSDVCLLRALSQRDLIDGGADEIRAGAGSLV